MADAAASESGSLLHDLLSDVIPYPIFRILAGFSNLIYRLLGTANDPTSWSSTLLPPLITFFLAYFALVTAYRTMRNMIALAWFGIKWGAIIGGLIAVWAWWTENTDAVSSTGVNPNRGFLDQLSTLGPLFNTLYSQIPDLGASSHGTSQRRGRRQQSSPYSRRRTRYGRRDGSYDIDSDIDDATTADLLDAGYEAFSEFFTSSSRPPQGGLDFAALLNRVIVEGRRQGIDALGALRAAGQVQDQLARFQTDPAAWFDSVRDRFQTSYAAAAPGHGHGHGHGIDAELHDDDDFPSGLDSDTGSAYNTRSRTRARQRQQQRQSQPQLQRTTHSDRDADPWWWSGLATGASYFFKQEPQPHSDSRSRSS
ncbi:hypothetical protein BCV70DRAFT_177744, partial [Testicularia cyperi]